MMRRLSYLLIAVAVLVAVPSGALSNIYPPLHDSDYILFSGSSLGISTTTTGEDILKTVTIPAGSLTAGGPYYGFTVFATISAAANTNQKTPRFRLGGIGGTVIAAHTNDATSNNRFQFNCVFVISDATHLDGQCTNSRVTGTSFLFGANIATVTYDFTAGLDVTITGESATAAGNLTLTAMRVALLRKGQ